IELDPASAHAHDNLATVYSEKKLFAQALEEYLTALKLEPDSATAHYNLACFLATHAHDMAIEQYKDAIELDPEYPDAHLNLGMTYADLDQRDEAKAEFKAAIELDPHDPLARHELEKEPSKVRSWLAADPMFDGLKGAPEFEQLLALN